MMLALLRKWVPADVPRTSLRELSDNWEASVMAVLFSSSLCLCSAGPGRQCHCLRQQVGPLSMSHLQQPQQLV